MVGVGRGQSSRPAVVARPVQAVVITAMPPSPASPAVDVVAACPPAATTTTCTTTAPPSPPAFDDLVALIDERSAIMEHDGGLDRETADLLAREMVLGRDAALVPSPPTVDVVAVDHAALRARQQPYVGAVLGRFPGVVRTPAGQGDPFAASSRPAGRRRPGQCQCGEVDRWVQVPIHNGQSARVDCGKCDRFGWFSVWYGQRLAGPDDDVQAGTRAAKYPVPANLSRHDLPGPAPGGAAKGKRTVLVQARRKARPAPAFRQFRKTRHAVTGCGCGVQAGRSGCLAKPPRRRPEKPQAFLPDARTLFLSRSVAKG